MIEAIEGFRLPRYTQIPDVGLYLEQVVRYVNTHLAPLGEPELTSSMVSNYVKQGLISSPIKKSYTAEHLARLLFIAVVKPIVPLEGLRMMFSIQGDNYTLPTAYDYFCDEFENMLGAAFGLAPARDPTQRIFSATRSWPPSTRSIWIVIWKNIKSRGKKPQMNSKHDRKCFTISFRQRSYTPLRCLRAYPLWTCRSQTA